MLQFYQLKVYENEFLKKLKAETQPYHIKLQESFRLLSPKVFLPEYIEYIQQLYGFYLPIEIMVVKIEEKLQPEPFKFKEFQKTPLLKSDLGVFNVKIDSIPLCKDLPTLTNLPQVLGCYYVLEGATHGGQFLYRHLKEALPIEKDEGYSFLIGYGNTTKEKWGSFQETLGKYVDKNPETKEIILNAAIETFKKIQLWLAQLWQRETFTHVQKCNE